MIYRFSDRALSTQQYAHTTQSCEESNRADTGLERNLVAKMNGDLERNLA